MRLKQLKNKMIGLQEKISIASVFIVPILLLLLIESIQRGSFISMVVWLFQSPYFSFVTLLFLVSIYTLLLALTNRPYFHLLLLAVFFITSAVVSFNKQQIRELPLMPWNLLMTKELIVTIGEVGSLLWIFILSITIAAAFLGFTAYIFGGIQTGWSPKKRILVLAISLVLSFSSFYLISYAVPCTSTVECYNKQGLVSGMLSYLVKPYMQKPGGYSPDNAEKILKGFAGTTTSTQTQLPDIIMVMGESFWDPTLLKNVTYSIDPVANLHLLQKQCINGDLQVNSYGGNTTNTEFEALTGMCMSFLAPDTSAYTDFFNKCSISLPLSLAKQGYICEALHPSNGNFLNRFKSFQKLGFQKFYTEADMPSAEKIGINISDRAAGTKIIDMYNAHKKKDNKNPYFSFTVTMQNHYDYSLENYGKNPEIALKTPPDMSLEEKNMLSGYIEGVHDADKLLGQLKAYFLNEDRKVIVVFFGDHLPALGKYRNLYSTGGYISSAGKGEKTYNTDTVKLHSTPFVIWDNFNENKPEKIDISASYLQAVLFEKYKLSMTPFQSFLGYAMKKAPHLGLSAWPQVDCNYDKKLVSDYKLLQYDFLFGN